MLGTALWVQGRMAESAEVFDGAIEGARGLDNAQALAWNLFNRAFDGARRRVTSRSRSRRRTESVEVARGLEDSVIASHAAWALAWTKLETGHRGARRPTAAR